MLRLSRRLVTLLLWLGIALLPLRGAATVLMPVLMQGGAPAATAAADDVAMPCHASPAAQIDAADGPGHTCSLCDLCHSAAAEAPQPPALPALLPDGPPQASACVPIEARAADGLFRPPRSLPA